MICCFALAIFVAILAAILVGIRYFLEKLTVGDLEEKAVFITGCDSGFGYLLALELLRKGVPVFAGCYSEKGEEELQKEAKSIESGRLITLRIDVTSQQSVDQAVRVVEPRVGQNGLWGLVNNAGINTRAGPDEWLRTDDYETMLKVNTLGVVRVTHAFMPLIKKGVRGRVVTCSSTAGRLAMPYSGPYSVSKFALEAYMDVLRLEMSIWGVSCHILEPGIFATDIVKSDHFTRIFEFVWNRCPEAVKASYGEAWFNWLTETMSNIQLGASTKTELVTEAYCHALFGKFPRRRYHVGKDCKMFVIPMSLAPTCVQDWVFAQIGKHNPKPLELLH